MCLPTEVVQQKSTMLKPIKPSVTGPTSSPGLLEADIEHIFSRGTPKNPLSATRRVREGQQQRVGLWRVRRAVASTRAACEGTGCGVSRWQGRVMSAVLQDTLSEACTFFRQSLVHHFTVTERASQAYATPDCEKGRPPRSPLL